MNRVRISGEDPVGWLSILRKPLPLILPIKQLSFCRRLVKWSCHGGPATLGRHPTQPGQDSDCRNGSMTYRRVISRPTKPLKTPSASVLPGWCRVTMPERGCSGTISSDSIAARPYLHRRMAKPISPAIRGTVWRSERHSRCCRAHGYRLPGRMGHPLTTRVGWRNASACPDTCTNRSVLSPVVRPYGWPWPRPTSWRPVPLA